MGSLLIEGNSLDRAPGRFRHAGSDARLERRSREWSSNSEGNLLEYKSHRRGIPGVETLPALMTNG